MSIMNNKTIKVSWEGYWLIECWSSLRGEVVMTFKVKELMLISIITKLWIKDFMHEDNILITLERIT